MSIEGNNLITRAVGKSRKVTAAIGASVEGQPANRRNALSRASMETLKRFRQRFKPEVGSEDELLIGLSEKYPVSTTIKPEIKEKVREALKAGKDLQHILFDRFHSFADTSQAEKACEYFAIQAIRHDKWVALSPDSVEEFVYPGTRAARKLTMSLGKVIDQSPPPEENPQADLKEYLKPLFNKNLVRQRQDSDGLYWWAPTEDLVQGIIRRVGIPQNATTALRPSLQL